MYTVYIFKDTIVHCLFIIGIYIHLLDIILMDYTYTYCILLGLHNSDNL